MIEQILTDSNTNWSVEKRPLQDVNGIQSGAYGVFRSDNNACLGVVGSRYTPMQNQEAVELLLEASNSVNLNISRGGLIEGGKKVYFQFQLPDITIGKSENKRYITALNSHDGSSPIGFGFTQVVVYCANTFFKAMTDVTKVRHTIKSKEKIKEISAYMKASLIEEEMVNDKLIQLSNTIIPDTISDEFILSIIGGNPETTKTKNKVELLKQSINVEMNYHGDNAYALFNGFTRYTNHLIRYSDTEDKRKSIISGLAYSVNNKALATIIDTYAPQTDKIILV